MGVNGRIMKKKLKNLSTEAQLSSKLISFSKSKDVTSALSLYEVALSDNTPFNQHQLNTLLYICSASLDNLSTKALAIDYGYKIFKKLELSAIKPNEASVTSIVRIATAKGDGDYAFHLIEQMSSWGLSPRLRTCSPVLLCFCDKLEADKAYEVEKHMEDAGIALEEPELAGLLKVSSKRGLEGRVYEYLHKLRDVTGCVQEETSNIIVDWFERFESEGSDFEECVVKEAILSHGGGWHGLGWLGKGKWTVNRSTLDEHGKCPSCDEHLAGVDISNSETERFANSVANLATERGAVCSFNEFKNWVDSHGRFESIIDGANVALYQQNFAYGGFSVSQVDAVVKELEQRDKKPLIVLHKKRVRGLKEDATCQDVVGEWVEKGILYTTPGGSNDDWYWLYAAVKLRCYLVTNDEMRDHIFELLGPKFFTKWKGRHQVRYTFVKGCLQLVLPSPFSAVIQESEKGSWHVPIACGESDQHRRVWLCVTRHL